MKEEYSIPDFHERLLALKEELNKRGLDADKALEKAAEAFDTIQPLKPYKLTEKDIKQIVEEELNYEPYRPCRRQFTDGSSP